MSPGHHPSIIHTDSSQVRPCSPPSTYQSSFQAIHSSRALSGLANHNIPVVSTCPASCTVCLSVRDCHHSRCRRPHGYMETASAQSQSSDGESPRHPFRSPDPLPIDPPASVECPTSSVRSVHRLWLTSLRQLFVVPAVYSTMLAAIGLLTLPLRSSLPIHSLTRRANAASSSFFM